MTTEPKNFRDTLTEAIERGDMTPAQLARISGVKVHVIRDLIRGKALTTSYENATSIANALKMNGFKEEQAGYNPDPGGNELIKIRQSMALTDIEMAEKLNIGIAQYRRMEDVEQYPELPSFIDSHARRIAAESLQPPETAEANRDEVNRMDIKLSDNTVTVSAHVDSSTIHKLIAKLEALALVITD